MIIMDGHQVKGHINRNPGAAPYSWEYWVGGGDFMIDYGCCRTWTEAMEAVEYVLGTIDDYDLHT